MKTLYESILDNDLEEQTDNLLKKEISKIKKEFKTLTDSIIQLKNWKSFKYSKLKINKRYEISIKLPYLIKYIYLENNIPQNRMQFICFQMTEYEYDERLGGRRFTYQIELSDKGAGWSTNLILEKGEEISNLQNQISFKDILKKYIQPTIKDLDSLKLFIVNNINK